MKKLKLILRIIIITPFVLGIPVGHKILSMQPNDPHGHDKMGAFAAIVAVPGMISCVIIFVALMLSFIFLFFKALEWIGLLPKNHYE